MTDIDKLTMEIVYGESLNAGLSLHYRVVVRPLLIEAARTALEAGMKLQRERDAVIARSFNKTPAFDLPCSPYDRTESIAEAIERTQP